MILEPDFFTHWKTQLTIDRVAEEAARLIADNPPEIPGLTADNPPLIPGHLAGYSTANPSQIQPKSSPLWVLRLWAHCQNRKQWIFPGMTNSQLRSVCGAELPPDVWFSILVECKWIEADSAQIVVRGWADVNAGLLANWRPRQGAGRPKNDPQKSTVNPPISSRLTIDQIDRSDRSTPLPPKGGESTSESPSSSAAAEKKEQALPGADSPGAAVVRLVHDAEKRICAMFARTTGKLAPRAERALRKQVDGLADVTPLKWQAIERMLQASHDPARDPEDYHLKSGWLKSPEALATDLLAASDAALAWMRQHISADIGTEKKEDGPSRWREIAAELYPDVKLPTAWKELPEYVRDAIREKGEAA